MFQQHFNTNFNIIGKQIQGVQKVTAHLIKVHKYAVIPL